MGIVGCEMCCSMVEWDGVGNGVRMGRLYYYIL